MIPESQKTHNDLVDILIESAQRMDEVVAEDGSIQRQLVLDPEIVWWKTLLVGSQTFGRFAYELKEWENLANDAINHMSPERAGVISKQIMDHAASWRRSIDAKSSESIRDKQNSTSTMIDKINKNKVEKVYSMKGDAKRSLMDGLLGREVEKDDEE